MPDRRAHLSAGRRLLAEAVRQDVRTGVTLVLMAVRLELRSRAAA